MAVIDVAGYVAELKEHAVDHGFHVHDERHFVETYSLRQAWEVDLHPEEACNGPLDLHLSLEVDPRQLLAFAAIGLAGLPVPSRVSRTRWGGSGSSDEPDVPYHPTTSNTTSTCPWALYTSTLA